MKNGIRQPQALSSSIGSTFCSTTTVSSASNWPAMMVKYWNEPKKQRLPLREISLM
ncbi:hypothetical protein D3C76_1546880 [compost metagenome]